MPRTSRIPDSEPGAVLKADAESGAAPANTMNLFREKPDASSELATEADTDSVFLECARLGWSEFACAKWRRHHAATLESAARRLTGKPCPGDERFRLSEDAELTQKTKAAGLSGKDLFPKAPLFSRDELLEEAAYLRSKGVML
ncbi:MAG: hypothetical protein ACRD2G_14005 [Terriglobia bacterium]